MVTSRLRIEGLKFSHIDQIKTWGTHEDPLMWEYNLSSLSSQSLVYWYLDRKKSFTRAYYGVFLEDKMVGYFGFKKINHFKKEAILGISMDPSFTSQGLGSLILERLLDLYFIEMKMRKLKLEVNNFNKRAIGLYEKFHFKKVGEGLVEFFIEDRDLEVLNDPKYFVKISGSIYSKTTKMELERGTYLEIQN